MSFIETPRFPEDISYHALGGPGYLTDVVVVNSGAESRNQVWSQGRATYEVAHAARTPDKYTVLQAFFRAMKGKTHGFRFKDWTDYQVTVANGVIGAGLGTGYPTGQMGKKYTAGALSETRNIVKPITTVAPSIYKNGVLLTEGTAAGQETPDLSTGIVTFYPTSSKTITAITKASPAVVTTSTSHGFTNGQTIYISGVIGMTQVNSIAFVIGGVTANTFQLTGINSTAYSTYTSGGTASLYPQSTDTLTWSGEFDIPVRFDIDQMKGEIIDKANSGYIIGWQSIPLIEIRFP